MSRKSRGPAERRSLRLIPLVPFNVINFGSGLTGVRLRDYVLATALGILPGTAVYQFLFWTAGEVTHWYDWRLLLALALFGTFTLLGRWASRRLTRSPQEPSPER